MACSCGFSSLKGGVAAALRAAPPSSFEAQLQIIGLRSPCAVQGAGRPYDWLIRGEEARPCCTYLASRFSVATSHMHAGGWVGLLVVGISGKAPPQAAHSRRVPHMVHAHMRPGHFHKHAARSLLSFFVEDDPIYNLVLSCIVHSA
eukprot:scaffold2830_cov123-Isochrysis_galbana.AAC.16